MKYVLILSGILIATGCQPATNHCLNEHSLNVRGLVAEIEKEDSVDTLVICPKPFQPALNDWIDYRSQQGRTIKVIAPKQDAIAISEQIRQVADLGQLRYVFLIGDVPDKRNIAKFESRLKPPARIGLRPIVDLAATTMEPKSNLKINRTNPLSVPTHYVPAEVNQHFGSEPEISTDHPYSDLTGDGLPDVSIGRLPANSIEEVREYLNRVMDYEQSSTADQHWKRRINFVAGVGGFGKTIDNVLEQIAKEVITGMIPSDYEVSMTLGSWRCPFCPDPRKFEQTVISRFSEGCQFLVYIGHGLPTELGKLKLPNNLVAPVMNCESASEVNCPNGRPIAIFLACYTGAIDHREDCLTEVLLRQPGGPIAIISGTRVTMPYGMSMLMLEFADKLFEGEQETLGELLKSAKREMVISDSATQVSFVEETEVAETKVAELRRMVQGTGLALSPSPNLLGAECREHLSMMHLFGDPLLQLHKPKNISITVPSTAPAGTSMKVEGTCPLAGKLCVELAYPRDRFRKRPQYRNRFRATDEEFNRYQAAYEEANDLTCEVCVNQVEAGPFALNLQIPDDVSGECVIRCILSADDGFALGSTRVTIQR